MNFIINWFKSLYQGALPTAPIEPIMIKFSKIPQLKNLLYDLNHTNLSKKINFKVLLTEKVHGANMGTSYSIPTGLYFQSRNQILLAGNKDYGCYQANMNEKEAWLDLIHEIAETHNCDLDTHIITVYSEWAGETIQQKSCLSGSPKKAVYFPYAYIASIDDPTNRKLVEIPPFYTITSLQVVPCIETWQEIYDLNILNPDRDTLDKHLKFIEEHSPLAKQYATTENPGEGLVGYVFVDNKIELFKYKGTKHLSHVKSAPKSKSRVVYTDLEQDYLNEAVTPSRLEQMRSDANYDSPIADMNFMSDFLKRYMVDINKEVMSLEKYSSVINKDRFKLLNRQITSQIRSWYLTHEQTAPVKA